MAAFETTMCGSWYRPPEILALMGSTWSGEFYPEHKTAVEKAEREAIRVQVHPNGYRKGLDYVSNGDERKNGYTTFLPSRMKGFSKTERNMMMMPPKLIQEMSDSNPAMVAALSSGQMQFANTPKLIGPLEYTGADLAKAEARDAVRIAKEEGAKHVFVKSPSPGVIPVFFPRTEVYRTHEDYLAALSKELRKEYQAILSVDGVDLHIDAPDTAMTFLMSEGWGVGFYDALPKHIDAINDAIQGLPAERIRLHYCYGNYAGSHLSDPPFGRVLPELLRAKVGMIVGENANPAHEGDYLAVRAYAKEHGWPKHMRFAIGAIDVKTPIVETPETVAGRLERYASIDAIGPERVLGSTDCGFGTFGGFDNTTMKVGVQKLENLVKGAELATKLT
jgi:5-methyltetrahydropteroyltriglutamate--homocysteine methyltransferase